MRSLTLALLIASSASAAVPPPVRGFMQTYCIGCHGPNKQKGDFRVDTLQISQTTADAENWQLVLNNLHLGEMPPEGEKKPKQVEVEHVTAWVQTELLRAATAIKGAGGKVVLRRLNRAEYANTIADLFDVHGDFTAGFAEDIRERGFDNNGSALMLSAAQMQEYIKAAEFVLSRAVAPEKKPETIKSVFTLHDVNRDARLRALTSSLPSGWSASIVSHRASSKTPRTSRPKPKPTPKALVFARPCWKMESYDHPGRAMLPLLTAS